MGAKQNKKDQQNDNENAQSIYTLDHPKFQKVKPMNNYQIMRIELPIQNIEAFKQWEEMYSKLDFFEDQYLLLARTCSFSKKYLCSESGTVQVHYFTQTQIDYENFAYLLKQQLDNRKKQKEHLSENEMWYIFYGLITAAHLFRKINCKVGDIRPQNIFLNDAGQIKIANICSWPKEKNNYEKALIQNIRTYISPEEIEDFKYSHLSPSSDPYIAQSFTIGVTLLQTALLQDSSSLYNYDFKNPKNSEFQERVLFEKLKKLWAMESPQQQHQQSQLENSTSNTVGYSWALKIAISALCQPDPEQRTTSQQLFSWLQTYQTQIVSLKTFLFDRNIFPPVKNPKKYQAIKYKIQRGELSHDSRIGIKRVQTKNQTISPERDPHSHSHNSSLPKLNHSNYIKKQYHNNQPFLLQRAPINWASNHHHPQTITFNNHNITTNPISPQKRFCTPANISTSRRIISDNISYNSSAINYTQKNPFSYPLSTHTNISQLSSIHPAYQSSQRSSNMTQQAFRDQRNNYNTKITFNNNFLQKINEEVAKSRQNYP